MLLLQSMTETVQIATLQDKQKGNINSKPCSEFACVSLSTYIYIYIHLCSVLLVCVYQFFEAISHIFYVTSDNHDKGMGWADGVKMQW